jgi:hypothetical protein
MSTKAVADELVRAGLVAPAVQPSGASRSRVAPGATHPHHDGIVAGRGMTTRALDRKTPRQQVEEAPRARAANGLDVLTDRVVTIRKSCLSWTLG